VERLQGVALGDKGAIEDLEHKVLGVFDWKVEGVEVVA